MANPKLIVIGLDAVSLDILEHYADKGVTPAISSLFDKGSRGRALPSFPAYTPSNWAVIATGADPSTTGAAEWWREVDGVKRSTFDSRAIASDTIFKAAARQGLTTLAIQYPGAYPPPDPEKNLVVAPLDSGLVSKVLYSGKVISVDIKNNGGRFSVVGGSELELLDRKSQKNKSAAEIQAAKAKAVGATEDGIEASAEKEIVKLEELLGWDLSVEQAEGKFTRVVATTEKGEKLDLPLDAWSDFFITEIASNKGEVEGVFRIKAYSAPNEGKLVLARSEIYEASAIGSTPELARDLLLHLGGFFEHPTFVKQLKLDAPHFDEILQEIVDELEYQVDWIAGAAKRVQDTKGWDIFYLHWHWPDSVLHRFLHFADPSAPGYNPETAPKAEKVIEEAFRLADRLVAGLLQTAGPDTTIGLVSDHGNAPAHYVVNITQKLEENGLLIKDNEGHVDLNKSLIYPNKGAGFKIIINTKDRGGPVKQGQYEEVQERIIDVLLDWKTPEGKRVVAVALKRKDAFLLNYWGITEGDVFLTFNSGFSWAGVPGKSVVPALSGAWHGSQVPTTYTGYTSNSAFFTIVGPKVKEGYHWDDETKGPFRLVDFLPTISKAAGIEPPLDAVGAPRNAILISESAQVLAR